MSRFLRPVTAMTAVMVATLGAAVPLSGGFSSTPATTEIHYSTGEPLSEYDFTKLKIVEPTLYHIEESYVEPARIDWEAMYRASLQAVERQIPSFVAHRDADRRHVSLEIGAFRTVLEVPEVGSSRELRDRLREVAQLLRKHIQPQDFPEHEDDDGVEPFAALEYTIVNGLLSTLDPHSMLFPPPDASEMDVENQGEFGGLGVTIIEERGRLVVESSMPNSPAASVGIRAKDVIHRIDGQSTINMSLNEAVPLLRGPIGSKLTIEIMREGYDAPAEFVIQRQLIQLNEVEAALIDGGVGLIMIPSFHSHVEQELHTHLTRLHREAGGELRGVILDLRGNPGGYLNQAVAVADTFLEAGEIVSTVDGYGRKQDLESASNTPQTEPSYPIVVLVNANSASASEIVAGALRNNNRAVIVGERSFGKGSVQNLHQFFDNSKLKLTINKYLTPGDQSIQAVGIPADIELVPIEIDSEDHLAIRRYWRERVQREADLDKSLSNTTPKEEQTAYRVEYYQPPPTEDLVQGLDLQDYQVRFARDLILSSHSSRRGEILGDAAPVVQTHNRRGADDIKQAFQRVGIDWRDGPAWTGDTLPVELSLEVEGGEGLQAGKQQDITLHIKNISDSTLFQVGVLTKAHDVLEGHEFLVGRLSPGETKSFTTHIQLIDGYPSTHEPVKLSVRDGGTTPLGEVQATLVVQGRERPHLRWTYSLSDNTSKAPSPGDKITLDLTLHNRGSGITGAAFARIRNRSGRSLDITTGTLEPGSLRTLDGSPCKQISEKSGCQRRLLPGERWSGRFEFELRSSESDWEVQLLVGDAEAYDYGSIARAGFYELFNERETITLSPSIPLPKEVVRNPPRLNITRRPAEAVSAARVRISGVATDDVGVRHVMVYRDGDKLFYQGSDEPVRSVPFTADVELSPGANVISVVAIDNNGLSATQSVVVWRGEPELVSRMTQSP